MTPYPYLLINQWCIWYTPQWAVQKVATKTETNYLKNVKICCNVLNMYLYWYIYNKLCIVLHRCCVWVWFILLFSTFKYTYFIVQKSKVNKYVIIAVVCVECGGILEQDDPSSLSAHQWHGYEPTVGSVTTVLQWFPAARWCHRQFHHNSIATIVSFYHFIGPVCIRNKETLVEKINSPKLHALPGRILSAHFRTCQRRIYL